MSEEIRTVSAAAFTELDKNNITVVDVREPDEILVHPVGNTINVPFSDFPKGLDDIPSEKDVYVLCRTGDFSAEVAEILTDRGYTAFNVEGGYQAIAALDAPAQNSGASAGKTPPEQELQTVFVDAKGLKCPGPIVKVADTVRSLKDGDRVKAEATEDAFASDIAVWCERTGNKLIKL